MLEKLKLFSIFAALLVGTVGLSACNTIEGAGQDIEAAGDGVEDTAEKYKGY